jgi:hypothetical protein
MTSRYNSYAAKIYAEHPIGLWALDDDSSATPESVDNIGTFGSIDVVKALGHSKSMPHGYYIEPANLSKNTSVPLVFGAYNSTTLAYDNYYSPGPVARTNLVPFSTISDNSSQFAFTVGTGGSQTTSWVANTSYPSGVALRRIINTVSSSDSFISTANSLVGGASVTAGQTYTGSVYVNSQFNFNGRIGLVWRNSSNTLITISAPEITTISANTPTRLSWTAEAPAGAVAVGIRVFFNTTSATSGQWIDYTSHMVELSSTLNTYFDGNTKNDLGPGFSYKWTGTPNASTSTASENLEILEHSLPSIIVPSNGFLIDYGRYFDLTVEFWANISNSSPTPKRIFGPIGSKDGLYVEGPFLGLKIGKNYQSHYIGTWGRPMLIQVSVTTNLANVIINGATVISMSINTESLELSPENLENGNSLDWLGFYVTPETSPMIVDCIAIYGYKVSDIIAKKRFVYGQGTQSVDTIFTSYTSTPVSIDYSFSNFGKNKTYPDLFTWENGFLENLSVDSGRLSVPNYNLPEISVGEISLQEWKDLQFNPNNNYFNLNKTGEDGYVGYLLFSNLNITEDTFRGFYGVFDKPELVDQDQIIFRIENEQSGKYFEILFCQDETQTFLDYRLNDNSLYSEMITELESFAVGIDLNNILKSEAFVDVYNLFTDKTNSKFFIGGYSTELEDRNNFTGNIYTIGFYTNNNYDRIEQFIPGVVSEEGYFDQDSALYLKEYISSYTIIPKNNLEFFDLDIAISGYWENNISLSSLSKTLENGERELDYLQFNIDYPESEVLVMDNLYEDILYRDTSEEVVRSFIIFKKNEDISDTNSWGDESQIVLPPADSVVTPTQEQINLKLETHNESIVYMPELEDSNFLDYSIILRLEFEVDGILSKPVKIRSLEIASRSLETTENPINTKFGKRIFPYVRSESEKDYKAKNPVGISKSRANYLYLTKQTGISLLGSLDDNKKISFPVNNRAFPFYQVSTIQFSINYSINYFNISEARGEDVLIFEIVGSGESHNRIYVDFSDNVGRIYSKKVLGGIESEDENTRIFLNGLEPEIASISPGEWKFVGLQFDPPLDFSGVTGEATLSGPARFDNISLYLISQDELNSKTVFRFWSAIAGTEESPLTWEDWYDPTDNVDDFTWDELDITAKAFSPQITPLSVYQAYVGSNTIIADSYSIDATASDILLEFKDYEYRLKTDISVAQKVSTPL